MKKHAFGGSVPPEYYTTRFRVVARPERWPAEFTIITACAPTGELWPLERSAAADRALARVLYEEGRWHHRITGYDPLGDHAEPGWAIEQTVDEGISLAARFDQLGLYVVQGGELFVIMTAAPDRLSPVAPFLDRLDDPH
ncbi:hypothetical protein Poly30_09150 [Planctomycetes bacterium Poly30]|uniref:DUF3293 domain-containing protein n=1 Tax=Saltatorellus ferox TaxID=2528018 RepID=A0A518EMU8_9BACT|nr:hypothetical protein Poly30_09150 [Planctomycetes bacterium Poly30]